MSSPVTHSVETDLSFSVAGGEVGLGLRRGALGADAVTHALVSTLRLLSALLVTTLVNAFMGTTRTLTGADGKKTSAESRFVLHELAGLSCATPESRNSTCRLCWALIYTFCCPAGWRRSSTCLCTDRCSRSRTPLQARPNRYRRWADRTLQERKIKLRTHKRTVCKQQLKLN